MSEYLALRYADHPIQLVSNERTHSRIESPITSHDVVGIAEDDWEGFGEEEPEKPVDARRLKGKAPLEKHTRKSEKKRRKQEERRKKRTASQPDMSKNTFEALGTTDEGEHIADDEEGDGKQLLND